MAFIKLNGYYRFWVCLGAIYVLFLSRHGWAQEPIMLVRPNMTTWNGADDFMLRLVAANAENVVRKVKENNPSIRNTATKLENNLTPKTEIDSELFVVKFKAEPLKVNVQLEADSAWIKFRAQGNPDGIRSGLYHKGAFVEYKLNDGLRLGYATVW